MKLKTVQRFNICTAMAAAVLACGGSLRADAVLPGASFGINNPCTSLQNVQVLGTFTCNGLGSNVGGTIQLLPAVVLSETALSTGGSARGDVYVSYWFDIVGGKAGDIVPVLFTANISGSAKVMSGAGQANSFDEFGFGNLSKAVGCEEIVNDAGVALCADTTYANGLSWSGTLAQNFQVGSGPFNVSITLSLMAISNGEAIAQGYADPMIQIDPSFANAANYSLVISPGIGNALPATGTPEPATFTLIGLPLVLLSSRRFRRFLI